MILTNLTKDIISDILKFHLRVEILCLPLFFVTENLEQRILGKRSNFWNISISKSTISKSRSYWNLV